MNQEQALEIINNSQELINQLNELKNDYENGEMDYGFEYGNFFNNDTNQKQVVIQWMDGKEIREIIVDSLEQAIVIIDKIEKCKGHLEENF